MRDTINTLQIEEPLKKRLVSVLNQFDSYRVGAVVNKENLLQKETKVIKMKTEKKKASFLERLFMTEYA